MVLTLMAGMVWMSTATYAQDIEIPSNASYRYGSAKV